MKIPDRMAEISDYLAEPNRVYSSRFCRRAILFLVERLDQLITENRNLRGLNRPAIFYEYPDNGPESKR